ncbi:proteoglycan 4a [Colossoma macropomum]|uniref:proteoglycan 4a n=1 Tax=Colossoma macropomum TaxID=42526 RepID=UPI001865190A|nr:proteoglycan 4a [Colossoma macropomum]
MMAGSSLISSLLLMTYVLLPLCAAQASCRGRCGEPFIRGQLCNCDYNCITHDECCKDYEDVCTFRGSCRGRCGETFRRGKGCECDPDCTLYNTCCFDYHEQCDATDRALAARNAKQSKPTGPPKTKSQEKPDMQPLKPPKKPSDSESEERSRVFSDYADAQVGSTPSPAENGPGVLRRGAGPTVLDSLSELMPLTKDPADPTGAPLPSNPGLYPVLPANPAANAPALGGPAAGSPQPGGSPSGKPLTIPIKVSLSISGHAGGPAGGAPSLFPSGSGPVGGAPSLLPSGSGPAGGAPSLLPSGSGPAAELDLQVEPPAFSPADLDLQVEPPAFSPAELDLQVEPPAFSPVDLDLQVEPPAFSPADLDLQVEPPAFSPVDLDLQVEPPAFSPVDLDLQVEPPAFSPVDLDLQVEPPAFSPVDLDLQVEPPAFSPADLDLQVEPPAFSPADLDLQVEPPAFSPADLDLQVELENPAHWQISLRPWEPTSQQDCPSSSPDLCNGLPIDALTSLFNGSIIVFKGHFFWLLDPKTKVAGPAQSITEQLGVPSPIDTAFTRCNCQGKTFIIKGDNYWVFENGVMEPGYPRSLSQDFDGLFGEISAALTVPATRKRPEAIYFFKKGGTMQKFSYPAGSGPTCTGKKMKNSVYNKFRRARQAEIRLSAEININLNLKGFPTPVTSALSAPNPRKPDGFEYFIFSWPKFFDIKISGEFPTLASPAKPPALQNIIRNWLNCP